METKKEKRNEKRQVTHEEVLAAYVVRTTKLSQIALETVLFLERRLNEENLQEFHGLPGQTDVWELVKYHRVHSKNLVLVED